MQKKRVTRRQFICRSATTVGAAALAAGVNRFSLVQALAAAQQSPAAPTDYRALVCVFLNGGNDGNNMVIPNYTAGYAAYSAVRTAASGLAIAQANLLPINVPSLPSGMRDYGLHPALTDLQALYNQGKMAVVCNVGPLRQPMTRDQYRNNTLPKPYQLFSHSDQVTQWQTSISNTRAQSGWGGRTADRMINASPNNGFPMITSLAGTAIYNTGVTTRPLAINPAPTPLNQVLVLNGFGTAADEVARRNSMNFLRTIDRAQALVAAASDTMQQAIDIGQQFSVNPTINTPFPNPATSLGNQLLQVAKVIKLNQTTLNPALERQIFFCSIGGFDTHQNQPADHQNLMAQVNGALKAFYDATIELGVENRVTTFLLSDFGRTLSPAGSGAAVGSDHGWGNHLFVLGGAVRGGDFYGVPGPNGTVFPTLALGGHNDTDTRGRWIPTAAVDQYAATLATWYGLPPADLPIVFPNIGNFASNNLGFML